MTGLIGIASRETSLFKTLPPLHDAESPERERIAPAQSNFKKSPDTGLAKPRLPGNLGPPRASAIPAF
jgi:hypothetical protein